MEYWIVENDTHAGPFSVETLKEMGISPDTYVWHKGLANWTKASDIPELACRLWTPPVPDAVAGTIMPQSEHPGSPDDDKCPPNYLAWSIVTTILFCMPLGVVAIIYSAMVKRSWMEGNREKARKASENAAWFSNGAFVAGLILFPFQIIIAMI